MSKKSTSSTFGLLGSFLLLAVSSVALLLTLQIFSGGLTLNDLRSKAYAGDFLQANGSDLVYKGQPVVLRGTNFDNIKALGAGIGSNNINDIVYGDSDYRLLSSYGANHVRFGVSYSWFSKDKDSFFRKLDEQVALAKKNNIWLTILPFTVPDGNDSCYEGYSNHCSIWTTPAYQGEFERFWIAVATRYKNEPVIAGYDLINEPTPPGPDWCKTWFNYAQKLRNTVSQIAPNQLVFISACSDPNFDRVFKETDGTTPARNVVYEVHDYDPMSMSHTGYNAKDSTAKYPGDAKVWTNEGQISLYFDKSTFDGTRYPGRYSTADRYSITWGKKNNVPTYIGEWGAQGWLNGYVQFIKDKAEVYTKLGVSHAYYTWRHSVNDGWRWGLFPTSGDLIVQDQAKLDAVKIAWANSVKPDFSGSGTPAPSPVLPTPSPTVNPTSTPRPNPSPTPVPTVVPTSSPRPTSSPTPSPAAPDRQPVTGSIRINDEWNKGYCATLIVDNKNNQASRLVQARFRINDARYDTMWGAKTTLKDGWVTVTPESWASYIPARGQLRTIEYCASKTGKNWKPDSVGVVVKF